MTPDIREIPISDLPSTAKVVFTAYSEESRGTNVTVWLSDAELGRRCGICRTLAMNSVKALEKYGLLTKHGATVRQVQGYQINHSAFGEPQKKQQQTGVEAQPKRQEPRAQLHCRRCSRLVRRLAKSGWCSSCNTAAELQRKIDGALVEIGADATPEELAAHLKNHRLITKIRRLRSLSA